MGDEGSGRFLAYMEAKVEEAERAAEAIASIAAQRFLDTVDASRVVHAHPDTIAAIETDGRWGEHFPSVRLVASPYIERGVLLSGLTLAALRLDGTVP